MKEGILMKIALINENSQADKNKLFLMLLIKYVKKRSMNYII